MDKKIDEMIANVRATMAVEGMEMTPLAEELGRKMLKEEISMEDAIRTIKEKYIRIYRDKK